MVHPGPGTPGARVSAVTFDGRTVELFNEPGQFGLKKMLGAATQKRKDGGVHELAWSGSNVSVAIDLKIVSNAEAGGDTATASRGFNGLRLPETIVGHAAPATAPAVASISNGGQ
jgi:type VI secretion system protein ImpL